ncbi:MAG TPA: ABC transporter ATP-binding protein [Streptosporangiaceae bacterium]|nr:ABC transporter ATP-binding protein [Streptosporangiaceae bacterium]
MGPGLGLPAERSKHLRGTLRKLLARLRPERLKLLTAVGLGVISVGFMVTGPKILGNATNILFDGLVGKRLPAGMTQAQAEALLRAHGQGQLADMLSGMTVTPGAGADMARFGLVLGLAALVYLLAAVFTWGQGFIMAGITQRIMYGLRREVEEKLARLPLRYFDSHPHGDILSRVTNDIDNLTTTLQQGFSQLLTSVLTIFGVLGMMFWISPLLAAVSLVTIPLAAVVTFVIARRSQTQFANQWERTGTLNGLVEETHTGHALVLAFGRRKPMIDEFGRQNRQLYDASFRAQFLSGVIMPSVQFLGNLNYVVIAVLGGWRVASGAISLGDVQAFIQYSRQFTMPITQIAAQMNMLQSGLASAERVFELLAAEEEAAGRSAPAAAAPLTPVTPLAPAPVAGRVQMQHLSFRYDPDTPLIEDFSLTAEPGQTIAIVGPTGAGKTTMVNLLMRFYEIDSGRILLDGTDYRALTRDQVRGCFGMVLQDTWLFAGPIADNIAYGKEGATDEEIVAAARAAYADHFVRTLPEGYRTLLDEDASNISAGQRQLLTIARAFLANPGILILDEATSNVDTRTEVLIQEAMARLRRGRTSFVIAHRLSTIRNADTIVVMNRGRIVEQGSHHDLLRRHDFYYQLYNSQFTEAMAEAS